MYAIRSYYDVCKDGVASPFLSLAEQLNPCQLIIDAIGSELTDDPPVQVTKGGVIAEGVSEELDDLRKILHSGKDYLNQLLKRESYNFV